MESSENYTVVDLFSGAGGLSLGFDNPERIEQIGEKEYDITTFSPRFQTELAVEYDEDAAETFEENFEHATVIEGNITELTAEDILAEVNEDLDVIVGGPPCKGFSKLNQIKTENLDDDRNELWEEFHKVVEQAEPQVFVMENVPRFLKAGNGTRAYKRFSQDLDYTVRTVVLDADAYETPQARSRGFMIGVLDKEDELKYTDIPIPTPTSPENPTTLRDVIGNLPYGRKESKEFDHYWHRVANRATKTIERMEIIDPGRGRLQLREAGREDLIPQCWRDIDDSSFSDYLGRMEWDEPGVTIRTGFYDPLKGRHLHPEPDNARTITPLEAARIQTFPDDFFPTSQSKTAVARQIGNAVPPRLGNELAETVHKVLSGEYDGTALDRYSGASDLTPRVISNVEEAYNERQETIDKYN